MKEKKLRSRGLNIKVMTRSRQEKNSGRNRQVFAIKASKLIYVKVFSLVCSVFRI